MYHPTRGGVRGGQDQFTWESVKDDKFRENYLGHSLMAPVGRWQQGKDLTWYAKDKSSDDAKKRAAAEELRRIKEAEADALAVALGGKKKNTGSGNVTQQDLKNAVKMDDDDHDPTMEDKGLGYGHNANNRMAQSSGATREVMPGSSSNAIPVNYTARPQLDQRVDGSDEDDSKRRRKEKKSKDKKKRKKHSHKHKHSRKHSHDLYSDESEDDRHYKNRLRDERGRSVHEHDRNADFASKSSSRNRKHDSRSRSPRRSNRSPRRYSGSPRRSSHTHSRHNRSISPAERADQHKKLSSSPSRRDVGSQSSMRRQEASSLSPDRRSRHRQYSRDSRRRRQSSYSRSPSRGRTMSRRDA